MSKAIVVVESPAKARTINKYLGRGFKVVASMGHIRDLPKGELGVDIDKGFAPQYSVIPDRRKVIKELRAAARNADQIYIATDPDREGEAIGWHLASELGSKKRRVSRLMFNEITKTAVAASLERAGEIDQRKVDAQQARRVLDRLVGYKLSPLLWDKVRRGLSAGRVQSVALKLVCDREAEIEAFEPEEYWHITARLAGSAPPEFDARLIRRGTENIKVTNQADAAAIVAELKQAPYRVLAVTTRERRKSAPPPFITSKLQQASRLPVKRTMAIAQQLYEGIELPAEGAVGLITYMRTDSTRVSEQALHDVRGHIASRFGSDFVPARPNTFRARQDAQDAHEAIRPTSVTRDPERVRPHLSEEQNYLYRLIWNRFVASQMRPATFDDTTVDVEAADYVLRAKGSVPKFRGWMAVHEQRGEKSSAAAVPGTPQQADGEGDPLPTGLLPALRQDEVLALRKLTPEQKFTQPPPRFSEATLVKALEENGIGRPSTYAAIIGVLQDREYTRKTGGQFTPTRLGRLVTQLLADSFDNILQVAYTRDMEERLDRIAAGSADYAGTLSTFYAAFEKDLARAEKSMPDIRTQGQPTDETCEQCGAAMLIKVGRFGMFLACSRYPACSGTRELDQPEPGIEKVEETCGQCGRPMVVRRSRYGPFLACTGYPDCKATRKIVATRGGMSVAKPDQPLDEQCPQCGATLVVKQGRFGEFTACSNYPACRFVKHKTTGVTCPRDQGEIVERSSRRGRFYGCVNFPKCDFRLWNRPVTEQCPKCGASFLVEKETKRNGRRVFCHREDCDYVRSAEPAVA